MTLTLRKTGEKSRPVPLFVAPTDNCEGRSVEGASSHSAQLSTPPTDNTGSSLAPTEAFTSFPTDNYGDSVRERPVDTAPGTLPTTLLTDKLGVSTTSPPAASTTFPTNNYGDGRRNITRGEDTSALSLTNLTHNTGALLTQTSAALSTSPMDNYGDGLKEKEVLNTARVTMEIGRASSHVH